MLNSCSLSEDAASNMNLIVKLKFDKNQVRLNNFGKPSSIELGNSAETPSINEMSAHYLELAPTANTLISYSSLSFHSQPSVLEQDRINTIYDYSFKNFKEKIPLDLIASKVDLVPSSFCRYFKSKTGKSFTQFIVQLKVSHAGKLLHSTSLSFFHKKSSFSSEASIEMASAKFFES